MRRVFFLVLIAAVAALGLPAGAYAAQAGNQRGNGPADDAVAVNGTLQDPKGEAIGNATIGVRDPTGNLVAVVTTDGQGHFEFAAQPGTYTLQLVNAGGRSLVSGGTIALTGGTMDITVVAAHQSLGALPGHGGLFGKGKGFTIATLAIAGAGGAVIARVASEGHASPSR